MNKQIMFHGGCAGCTRQETEAKGIDYCIKCKYFDADWDLPDLNNAPPTEADIARKEIKARNKKRMFPRMFS